jgi:hypothetical protein
VGVLHGLREEGQLQQGTGAPAPGPPSALGSQPCL